MKFLRSKLFIILLCVALVLTIVPTVLSAMGHTGLVRNVFMTVTFPVRWIFNAVARGLTGFAAYFTEYNALQEENESLREQLNEANSMLDQAEVAIEENKWLREFFDIAEGRTELSLISANVVGYENGNTSTIYTLDRGSTSGVKINMAVITEDGVVGCVTEVGLNWCKITSIIEDSMAVGAYLPRTGEHGIIKGDYSCRADGTCLMERIPDDSDVKEGDLVLSSGIGSIYPKDIAVGRVLSVSKDPASRTITATVKPFAKFEGLKRVMIIRLATSVEESEPQETEGTENESSPVESDSEQAE